jgi:hypothetical protein
MKKVLRVMPEPCERMQFVNCFLAVNSSCWYSLPSARSGASLLSPSSYACTGFADSKHSVDDLRLKIEYYHKVQKTPSRKDGIRLLVVNKLHSNKR